MAKRLSKELSRLRALNAFIFGNNNNAFRNNKTGSSYNITGGGSTDRSKNLSNIFMPISPTREVTDIIGWREGIQEMERAVNPFRVKAQTMYRDTVIDPQVDACMNKRRNLTLLREFALVDENGDPDEYWTSYFDKKWMREIMSMILDAKFYGYTLIAMGDIKDDELINPSVVRRDNISPERGLVGSFPYDPAGERWDDGEVAENHIWVPTVNEHGTASCGFGILYVVTMLAIRMKNMLNDNADYMQFFATPFGVVKSDKSNEDERQELKNMMDNRGSSSYAIIDKDEDIEFINNSGGNGAKSYDTFEMRINKAIAKVILGHSDAIESTPGKLGAGQGGKDSAAQMALYEVQQSDANFITPIINEELITRLRFHGINIPENLTFVFLNSEEESIIEERKQANNHVISDSVQLLAKGGVHVDLDWLEETTGMKFVKKQDAVVPEENKTDAE